MVEHSAVNRRVVGSSPTRGATASGGGNRARRSVDGGSPWCSGGGVPSPETALGCARSAFTVCSQFPIARAGAQGEDRGSGSVPEADVLSNSLRGERAPDWSQPPELLQSSRCGEAPAGQPRRPRERTSPNLPTTIADVRRETVPGPAHGATITASMTELIEQQSEPYARLRVFVSVLGEAADPKWWRTEFLTGAGLRFLDRLYPRTRYAAAIRATGVAARELHDSSIGRGGVYHLFRLPEPFEGQFDALARRGAFDQILRDLGSSLETREALLAQFDILAAELPETEPGPQRIGSVRDLLHGNLLGSWAGAYRHAFRKEYRVFPYVEVERTL